MICHRIVLAAFAGLVALGACTDPGYTRAPVGAPERERYESPESRPVQAREIAESRFDFDGGMEDNGLLPGDDGYEPAAPYDPSGPDAQPVDWDGTEDDLDRDEDGREADTDSHDTCEGEGCDDPGERPVRISRD